MVRAGAGGYLMEEFHNNEIVAIGWNDLGFISKDMEYDQLRLSLKKFILMMGMVELIKLLVKFGGLLTNLILEIK